jgi:hypothetical protein
VKSFIHPAVGANATMTDDERAPIWDVADPDGRVLANKISFVALRARIDAGLLPAAALVLRSGEQEWRPISDLLTPSRASKITMLWYVTRNNAPVIGPVDTDRIQRGLASARVPIDCMVCRVGDDRWRPIGDVAEFERAVREASFDGELTLVADAETRIRAAPPPPFARFTS